MNPARISGCARTTRSISMHHPVHGFERGAHRRLGGDHERRHVLGRGELGADEGNQQEARREDEARRHEGDDLVPQHPVEESRVAAFETP